MFRRRYWKRWVLIAVICICGGQLWWKFRNQNAVRPSATNTASKRRSIEGSPLAHLLSTKNISNPRSGLKLGSKRPRDTLKRPEIPVMIWWDSVYTSVDEIRTCGQFKCRVTNNRSFHGHPDTKMFIFYGSHFKPYNLPFPRHEDHLWALMHEESPRNAYILSHEPTLSIFNFTSSYNQKSNYPITTQWLQCPDWLQDTKYVLPLVDKNRLRKVGLAPILYLQSDCDVPSDRDTFVRELQRYIPVDSYGPCVHNKQMPERLRFHDDMSALEDADFFRFAARYKFTLAMENYVCDDYVTEKLWRPLRLGSVPIVFGAPNVKNYLPSLKSAIIIDDFEDIEDLANYINLLDGKNKLYKQYLSFKEEPINNYKLTRLLETRDWKPEFCDTSKKGERESGNSRSNSGQTVNSNGKENKYDSIFTGFECYLCEKIHEHFDSDKTSNSERVTYKVDSDHFYCPSPRKFDKNGRYSVHSSQWSAEWNSGKFEAAAMMRLYESQQTTTKKEFEQLVQSLLKDDLSTV